MKRFLTLSLLIVSTLGYSQSYNFKPQWKKGDVKQITISQIEREYEDGKLISDTTIYNNDARVKVLAVNNEDYILEILFENQALTAALELYNKLGEDLKEYKHLKLLYSVNKETAESELLNWEEVQKFINNSFDQISAILDDKAPDTAPFVRIAFMPIKEAFKSKENVESYVETNIGYVLTPFNKNFEIGETITKTESQKNPLNPRQEVSATTLLTLGSVDEDSKTCTINQEVELDLTEFIKMMQEIALEMAESFGGNDSTTAEKIKEMDDFEINIENLKVFTFNFETSWVTKVVGTGIVSATKPKTGINTKKEIITTTILK